MRFLIFFFGIFFIYTSCSHNEPRIDLELKNRTGYKIMVEIPIGVFNGGPTSMSHGSTAVHLGYNIDLPSELPVRWRIENDIYSKLVGIPSSPDAEHLVLVISIEEDNNVTAKWVVRS